MNKPKILVQLDTDAHPSLFDSVVAIDAGVDDLLRYQGVTPDSVLELVHGAIFTRSPDDLWRTAIFVGGSNVATAEAVLDQIKQTFFGPLRVSVMLDPAGANTTAAAAVLAAMRHVRLRGANALVLAATGPVGQRAVRLLAREGAVVRVGSRSPERAQAVCDAVSAKVDGAQLSVCPTNNAAELGEAIKDVQVIISAGAEGIELLPLDVRKQSSSIRVLIDLNAVPPAGIEGVEVVDRAAERARVIHYGAIGVGATKMRIHKSALQLLFDSNLRILDAEELYELGRGL
jgi:methylenetetrahydrofolate/methylenetetrahydromethanopterin dehydrogenase (NADP+)